MRVCQIMGGNGAGGLEKHVVELSNAISLKGCEVVFIGHKNHAIELNEHVKFVEIDLTSNRFNPFVLFNLWKTIQKNRPDIIHAHANKAVQMVVNLKPFISAKIIATLHGYKKNVKAFRQADWVITVSDRIAEKLNIQNKTTIYNGLKIEDVKRIDLYEEYDLPKEKMIVCAVGRMEKVKGFDLLISTMCYSNEMHLILVGDGQEKDELKALAKRLKVDHKITFVGSVGNLRAKEIISGSHMVVITSKREGFSYVFAEALILRKPLLSTDVADIRKIIPEQFIIPFDNPQLIAEKIDQAGKNYDDTLEQFSSAFEYATKNFSLEHMCTQTLEVYKKVLL